MRTIPSNLLIRAVREALQEDIGAGDLTTEAIVPPGMRAHAVIKAQEALVVAGVAAARHAFLLLDPDANIRAHRDEGAPAGRGEIILHVEGEASAILRAERTALNFLGRLSGIATLTRKCVDAVAGTRAAIYDTRKTTPGLRLLERRAVELGGGRNHRFGLYDAVLIKDNHLALCAGVGAAVIEARRHLASAGMRDISVEVEVESLDGLEEALSAGAGIVLLDNMPVPMIAEAVRRTAGRAVLEASGGITLSNIQEIAGTGVDRISLGALTHSAPSVDFSLALQPLN